MPALSSPAMVLALASSSGGWWGLWKTPGGERSAPDASREACIRDLSLAAIWQQRFETRGRSRVVAKLSPSSVKKDALTVTASAEALVPRPPPLQVVQPSGPIGTKAKVSVSPARVTRHRIGQRKPKAPRPSGTSRGCRVCPLPVFLESRARTEPAVGPGWQRSSRP